MARIVKCGLIQTHCELSGEEPVEKLKEHMIEKNMKLIDDAGTKGVQILCLQELFYGPYFPAEQMLNGTVLQKKSQKGPL